MENSEVKVYSMAFAEISKIISLLDDEILRKIPSDFVEFINRNMDRNHTISEQDILEEKILPETADIIALIYRDFLCDDEERERLKKQDEIASQKRRMQYTNLLVQKMSINAEDEVTYNTKIVEKINPSNQLEKVQKVKWYNKFWNKIKNLFKK